MIKLLLILLIPFSLAFSSELEWRLVKDKSPLYIYEVKKQEYRLKHFKAQSIIKKNLGTVLAALQDTQACPRWVYNCVSNEMLNMEDIRKRIYHTIIHSPLWFKDRDFFLQSYVKYNPVEKLLVISFESIPNYAKVSKERVRIEQIEMQWSLKKLSNEMTLVTYHVYIDPRLPIKSLNNKMIVKSIFQTMVGLTNIVENSKYSKNKYSESELELLTED